MLKLPLGAGKRKMEQVAREHCGARWATDKMKMILEKWESTTVEACGAREMRGRT